MSPWFLALFQLIDLHCDVVVSCTFTDRVRGKVNSIGRVRLSARLFPLYLQNLTFEHDFCMCKGHDRSSPEIESQGHRSRSMQKCVYTRVSTAAFYEYWLSTVTVGFYCHVISCASALRGVQRGAAETSACGRGNAISPSVRPRSPTEDSFSSQQSVCNVRL